LTFIGRSKQEAAAGGGAVLVSFSSSVTPRPVDFSANASTSWGVGEVRRVEMAVAYLLCGQWDLPREFHGW